MEIVGPFNLSEWRTLKQLRLSILDPKIAKKRKDKEQYLFNSILRKVA